MPELFLKLHFLTVGDGVAVGRIRDLGAVVEAGIATFKWRAERLKLGSGKNCSLSLLCY